MAAVITPAMSTKKTVRGMRFYHPALLNVSDHYARFLAGKGEVTIATIVR